MIKDSVSASHKTLNVC